MKIVFHESNKMGYRIMPDGKPEFFRYPTAIGVINFPEGVTDASDDEFRVYIKSVLNDWGKK